MARKPLQIVKKHSKRKKCDGCNKLFHGYKDGDIKVIADRLIDHKAIIKHRFCLISCAVEYLNKYNKPKKSDTTNDHKCEICGNQMIEVDCDLWMCPDYPHNAKEGFDCHINDTP